MVSVNLSAQQRDESIVDAPRLAMMEAGVGFRVR